MKISILNILAFLTATILYPSFAYASDNDFVFTYDYEGATHDIFGVRRCVQIDAAMHLKDPSLVGFEILGVSIDIPSKDGCECDPTAFAWLSKNLQVDGEYNLPDIQETKGEIINYGTESEPELRLDIMFENPYQITDEGVYAGYSVVVKSCNVPGSGWTSKYPIVTVCDIDQPESFMIHSTKDDSDFPQAYPEWTDVGQDTHQALAMRVLMRGKRMNNAAGLKPLQTLYVAPGTSGFVYTDLSNYGTQPISSIEYSYAIESAGENPITITKELTLDTPILGQIGAYATLDLPFEAPETVGKYSVEVRVGKVNNVVNEFTGSTVVDMEVVPFLPANRPLVEDYTGLWCGYCPAVYVAVKQMQDKYGEDFLSIAYHIKDEIQGVAYSELPSSSSGLPIVYIKDRSEKINYDNLESIWLRQRRGLAEAAIDVKIYWEDTDRTSLRAESKVRFVYDHPDADYMLTYAMVEDGMSDPKWMQANQFMFDNFEGPYWDLFCGQPIKVNGLVYDDVIVNFPSTTGIEGSLPTDIYGDTEYYHSSVLDLKDGTCKFQYINNYGESIIKDPNKLRIVALLIDGKTGKVCNAATSGYSGDAEVFNSTEGVESIHTDLEGGEIITTEYYSLDGIQLNSIPNKAPVIIVRHMEDGSIRTEKKIRR